MLNELIFSEGNSELRAFSVISLAGMPGRIRFSYSFPKKEAGDVLLFGGWDKDG